MAGFVLTIVGIAVFLAMVGRTPGVWAFAPGLFLIGLGVGLMLTPSVNVVQSSFGEEQQGEISGLSRSVSNLGSSLGTAIAGTILVAGLSSARVRAGHGRAGRDRRPRAGGRGPAAAAQAGTPPAAPAPEGGDPAHAPGTADGSAGSPRLPAPRASAPAKAPPAGGPATTGGGT